MDLLNQIYPVGSLFICKTGTGSPASKYGGNWQCLAENVVLPLGNYANVDTLRDAHAITGLGLKVQIKKAQTLGVDTSGMVYSTDGLPSGSGYNNPVFTNLYADLATATNAINNVDVWQRIEKI